MQDFHLALNAKQRKTKSGHTQSQTKNDEALLYQQKQKIPLQINMDQLMAPAALALAPAPGHE